MNTDPTVNIVVVEVKIGGRLEKILGNGPTQSDDCVRNIWKALAAEHGIHPGDVRRLYSEWEPSSSDKAFIDATFPVNLEVTFSFPRPAEEDWEKAMRQVSRTIGAAIQRKPWWRFWS